MDYLATEKRYLSLFEEYLNNQADSLFGNEKLISAMKYSLQNGGKRVRPMLMLATADMLSVNLAEVLPFAFSLECIHTYSLIHDDLPAMDNDDMRRGKPSNHKVFGEDYAIIAGDGLLNFAYEHLLEYCNTASKLNAARIVAAAAGYSGMVGGQAYDLVADKQIDEKSLLLIDGLKTAKLIQAAVTVPAILADREIETMKLFGEKLGIAFQFVDDLLDAVGDSAVVGKTLNKDVDENKLTAVRVFGIEEARRKAESLISDCVEQLTGIDKTGFLTEFALRSKDRVK